MYKLIISSIFLLFSYLQFNDGVDAYLWAFIYFMAASITVFNTSITKYKIYFLLSIISFLFVQNLNSILTIGFREEFIYEFGGMLIILYLSYFKLSKRD
ncbi:MAG: hypothetical protein CBE33_03780 [Candidatus Pelagibacter sp. TMED273]|nr:MAG: hypothetical protein CBE33_03780 [Candidatus Pelagibacter sp. TMED273]|tara:strand:+ start:24 stop:320 length:297 start_codon:yes stop_codon:yes gene_type:complete